MYVNFKKYQNKMVFLRQYYKYQENITEKFRFMEFRDLIIEHMALCHLFLIFVQPE